MANLNLCSILYLRRFDIQINQLIFTFRRYAFYIIFYLFKLLCKFHLKSIGVIQLV